MNNSEYPLFTVIIPQKNRAEYLVHTLRSCMLQDYPNFEIIVSDDCSDDNSVEVAKKLAEKDPRIKVFAHEQHLGMRDNFEFALKQVRVGYVLALGGDDGIVAGGIWRMYKILMETKRNLLSWVPAYFSYEEDPGSKCRFMIKRKKNDGYHFIKSSDFLNKIASSFHYQTDDCPMFYMKGVVSTELVEKVKSRSKDNCFYGCPTPDGFSGVVLAGEVEDFVHVNEPLSIVGTTNKSQGKIYMQKDQKSKEEAQIFFNDNLKRTMHAELANQQYSPLQTLMTADYLLTARDLAGWPGHFEPLNFENLIRKTFKMLEKSAFENEILIREMKILREIAIHHNMLDLFNQLLLKTKRKVVLSKYFDGSIVTFQTIMFDGSEIGVNNVYDASLVAPFIYKVYNMISIKEFLNIIVRSFRTIKNSKNFKVKYLPRLD